MNNESYPAKCPITGRPFFMIMKTPDGEVVPTYGGPFDSYTIPIKIEDDGDYDDFPWLQHRYDHDEGAWVDDECISDKEVLPEHRSITL